MTTKMRMKIVGPENPSTADVIDAFARAFDEDPKVLTFQSTDNDVTEGVRLNSLAYESGKPGMFLIAGFTFGSGRKFTGFYDANRKRGHMDIESM